MSMTSYSRVEPFGAFRTIRPEFNRRALRSLEDDYLEPEEDFEDIDEEDEDEEEEGDT